MTFEEYVHRLRWAETWRSTAEEEYKTTPSWHVIKKRRHARKQNDRAAFLWDTYMHACYDFPWARSVFAEAAGLFQDRRGS